MRYCMRCTSCNIVYDIAYDIACIKGVRVISPLLRPESIYQEEQGLTWELAILAAPCPDQPCPKLSNLAHQTGIGPADSGNQDSEL
jgi:hypothetical protein